MQIPIDTGMDFSRKCQIYVDTFIDRVSNEVLHTSLVQYWKDLHSEEIELGTKIEHPMRTDSQTCL